MSTVRRHNRFGITGCQEGGFHLPRRLIDSRIYSNEKYGELPLGAKELLKSIVTHADEDGRLKAGSKFLRSITFPYNEEVSSAQTEEWRDLLAAAGFIRTYGKNGDVYCDVPGWQDPKSEFHQILRKDRYTPSLLPRFDDGEKPLSTTGQPLVNQPATAGMEEDKVSKGKVSIINTPNGVLFPPASKFEAPQEASPASKVCCPGERTAQPPGQTVAIPAVPGERDEEAPASKVLCCPGERTAQPPGERIAEPGEREKSSRTKGGNEKGRKQSDVGLVFQAVHDHYGFDGKTKIDPIPNYGVEGRHIKRMLDRGFTVQQIVMCWGQKVAQRGNEFVSFHYVNEDIGKEPKNGARGPTTPRVSTPRRSGPRFGGYSESLNRRRAGPGSGTTGVSAVPGGEICPSPEGGKA